MIYCKNIVGRNTSLFPIKKDKQMLPHAKETEEENWGD